MHGGIACLLQVGREARIDLQRSQAVGQAGSTSAESPQTK
jgi:hypothetical protein